jgi:hypothetical protein
VISVSSLEGPICSSSSETPSAALAPRELLPLPDRTPLPPLIVSLLLLFPTIPAPEL